jgi:beta-glucosidase
MTPDPRFPEGFLWGTATSAYQIEGSLDHGGRGPSIWDTFAATPGKVQGGADGSLACDHWRRWPEDIALMRALGVGAYRFSVSWPRVFPTGLETAPAQAGLDVYDRIVDALLADGIDPWVTVYHWDLPQGLEDRGGWRSRDTVDRFVAFAQAIAARLGDRVGNWITHNEPWCSSHLGYGTGLHAPGHRDMPGSLAAAHHLLLSHGRAVPALRAVLPTSAKIGIALNFATPYPASSSAADQRAAERFDGLFTRWYLDPVLGKGYPRDILDLHAASGAIDDPVSPAWLKPGDLEEIAARIDFLGINYYSRAVLRDDGAPDNLPREIPEPPPESRTDIGWEVFPDGLYDLLRSLQRGTGGMPLVVTENGAAYNTGPDEAGEVPDDARVAYLRDHVRACRRAIADGVDLYGFFAWSLLDNFEWHDGYTQRFGIVHVDFETMRRTPKRSFRWFARAIAGHAVPEDLS